MAQDRFHSGPIIRSCDSDLKSACDLLGQQAGPVPTFDALLHSTGSSLGIPIAAAIKGMNRSAIAMGGALQVLFGVGGQRWWNDPHWRKHHITPAWISVPTDQVPQVAGG